MKMLSLKKIIFVTLLSALLTSCSQDSDPQQAAVAENTPVAPADEKTTEKAASLGGTRGRLVQIM